MEKDFKVTCPCCDSILIIDRIGGKIIETRKPLVEDSSGDRFADAFLKNKRDKEKRASALDNIADDLEKRKKLSEDIFKASLKDARKDKDIKPHSIFDAD